MRTYGRINGVWTEVDTDANGYNDQVWLTTLAQCIQLSPGESPFYAQYGIPAQPSVVSQILPSFYVSQLQTLFAQYFASLIISQDNTASRLTPTYKVDVLTNQGAKFFFEVAI